MSSVASFLLSSNMVDTPEGPADLVNYTIYNTSFLTSMQSTSEGTSGKFHATLDAALNTILERPANIKDVAIEQAADIDSSSHHVNLLLYLYCLISGCFIVAISQGGLNAKTKHVSIFFFCLIHPLKQ